MELSRLSSTSYPSNAKRVNQHDLQTIHWSNNVGSRPTSIIKLFHATSASSHRRIMPITQQHSESIYSDMSDNDHIASVN